MPRIDLIPPPLVLGFYLLLIYGLYRLVRPLQASGQDHPGKHQPYASGEELEQTEARHTYQGYYQLALIFGVMHLATLVLATVPATGSSRPIATFYLVAVGISVIVLARGIR
jgi:NADH:ubiquinone oxidoreductase subunit 3 (subunit A)